MMSEKVSNFYKDLKERFSSPFFSAFIIAWIILNWKIPISLLFYSQKELELDGFSSYISLITQTGSSWNYIIAPLGLGVLYIFVYPVIRNLILAYNAWNRRWGSTWIFSISKQSKVSLERYLTLQDEYSSKILSLEKKLESQQDYREELEKMKVELSRSQEAEKGALATVEIWKSTINPAKLNGTWTCTFGLQSDVSRQRIYEVVINNNELIFDSNPPSNLHQRSRILGFSNDIVASTLSFVIQGAESNLNRYKYFFFKAKDDYNFLEGTIDGEVNLYLKKLQ